MSEDIEDLIKFVNKHSKSLENEDHKFYFCLGFLVSRGYNWDLSCNEILTNKEL